MGIHSEAWCRFYHRDLGDLKSAVIRATHCNTRGIRLEVELGSNGRYRYIQFSPDGRKLEDLDIEGIGYGQSIFLTVPPLKPEELREFESLSDFSRVKTILINQYLDKCVEYAR